MARLHFLLSCNHAVSHAAPARRSNTNVHTVVSNADIWSDVDGLLYSPALCCKVPPSLCNVQEKDTNDTSVSETNSCTFIVPGKVKGFVIFDFRNPIVSGGLKGWFPVPGPLFRSQMLNCENPVC